jgi:hypothetical protein
MEDNKVAVLLEDLLSQFRTFGEGLDGLQKEVNHRFNQLEGKLDAHITKNQREFAQINKRLDENHQEHQLLKQMVKDIDRDVQFELKRIK